MKLIFLLTLFISLENCFSQSSYSIQSSLDLSQTYDPDEKGYRYCASWMLPNKQKLFSLCDAFSMNRCGKTLEVSYECCNGFLPAKSEYFGNNDKGNPTCAQTLPIWNSCSFILKTYFNTNKFADLIGSNDEKSSYTYFIPESETISDVNYHTVKGKYYLDMLRDKQMLTSLSNDGNLLISRYSFGVICVDCIEVTKSSYGCKNGIIHFLKKPLQPKSQNDNLMKKLSSDSSISSFVNDLPPDIKDMLTKDNSNYYTIFAVLNEEWNKIKSKHDTDSLLKIIKNHILSRFLCTIALTKDKSKLMTMEKETVLGYCTGTDTLERKFVQDQCGNEIKIISEDNVATNGVYHNLERALIPTSAKKFDEILKDPKCLKSYSFQAEQFLKYFRECDLKMKANKQYTVLIPIDASFDWWKTYGQFKPEYDRFQTDPEYRCRVARYHIIEQNKELDKIGYLWHEQKGYKTNNIDELYEVDYFLKNKDQSDLYFHYSPVVDFKSVQFNGGSFYLINRINVIPEMYIIDVLEKHGKTKLTHGQVVKTQMDPKVFKRDRPLNLFLATIDEGLLTKGELNKTIEAYDDKILMKYLLLHTVPLYLWGGDIGYFKRNTVHKFMSKVGIELIFWMDQNGVMRIGYEGLEKNLWPEVIKFNLHAKDGIVWLLKNFIECPKTICPHKLEIIDYDLYDVYVSSCHVKELPGIKDTADAKVKFDKSPIKLAEANPNKCVIYKQPTWKAEKKISSS